MRESPPSEVADLWADVRPPASRRMLLAAVESFATRGYNATTTREIAQRAGMSPAAVYVHYRSKADLLYEISLAGHDAVLREVQGVLEDSEAPAVRLRRFMAAFVSWHARNHTVARVIQYELHALAPERFDAVRDLRRRLESLLRSELRRGVRRGDFEVEDVRLTTLALLSLGIDVARWYRPREATPEQLGAAYAGLAMRMVRASEGA